jgi:hypothetical protein
VDEPVLERVHTNCESDYPDVGNGEVPCCYGAAVYGPGRCTCWESEYDHLQQEPKAGPMQERERMCVDCAFRPDSPERQGDERYSNSDEDGIERVLSGTFLCHAGMRSRTRERHPSGALLEVLPGAYAPPSPPCKADGSPAEYCAGWAAERRRRAKEAAAHG